jgi:hypothetical protein
VIFARFDDPKLVASGFPHIMSEGRKAVTIACFLKRIMGHLASRGLKLLHKMSHGGNKENQSFTVIGQSSHVTIGFDQ